MLEAARATSGLHYGCPQGDAWLVTEPIRPAPGYTPIATSKSRDGDEFLLENIRPFDWADFARRTGTPRSLLAREMRRIGMAAPAIATTQAAEPDYEGQEKDVVAGIATFVQGQARKLVDMAAPMLKVDLE